MDSLPVELATRILCHIDLTEVFKLRRLSKSFNNLLVTEYFITQWFSFRASRSSTQAQFLPLIFYFGVPEPFKRILAASSKLSTRLAYAKPPTVTGALVIPESLSLFTRLTELRLAANAFAGSVPLSCLPGSLRTLSLASNNLTGSIEPFTHLSSLNELLLNENGFSGHIPSSVANWKLLRRLRLDANNLTGPIPPELGSLKSLLLCSLAKNQLSGPIPSSIGNLRRIMVLRLNSNLLTGEIPNEITRCTHLVELYLNDNRLSGGLPQDIACLDSLVLLYLKNNRFKGREIPELLTDPRFATFLTTQWIASTNKDFKCIRNLNYDWIHWPLCWQSTYARIKFARETRLIWKEDRRLFDRAVPSCIFLATSLTHLVLAKNNLDGAIPKPLFNLVNLEVLDLSVNYLTGSLPDEVGQLKELRILNLNHNCLVDAIPATLTLLIKLKELLLGFNQFTDIPPLSGCVQLAVLDISANRFGTRPDISKTALHLPMLETVIQDENEYWQSIMPYLPAE
ncbi:hypothetical protein HDU79_003014 [Rhizoclosmatium sp. JEL0117]|nr:hypothetical protein HDU79_003014 [Rhizoclosmatium sp. JEL0117]